MKGKTIHELQLGQSAHCIKVMSDEDVMQFAHITGDFNPVHVDEEYASTSIFGQRVVHGMLTGSLFSSILGMQLPGAGAIYLSQELSFRKPVFLHDTITAVCTVKELMIEKNRVIMDTTATNQRGEVVVIGQAILMPVKE